MKLPRYAQLPEGSAGGRVAWGLFGEDDERGLVNMLTPELAREAARLVRTGRTYLLSPPIGLIDPPMFGRGRLQHIVLAGAEDCDDYIDNYYPQASAHWDSLAHVAYAPGTFYNGSKPAGTERRRNTIENWAPHGIATRAVLLDLTRTNGFSIERAYARSDLEIAVREQHVDIRQGDLLMVRTGFLGWYAKQPQEVRKRYAHDDLVIAPGLENTEDMAEYLWDLHIWGVVSDNPAVESCPIRSKWELPSLHQILIGGLGMALGELWQLDELAAECERDGSWEIFVAAAPMLLKGGIGSPANSIALK